jgi:hypothetical protein
MTLVYERNGTETSFLCPFGNHALFSDYFRAGTDSLRVS